MNSPHPFDPGMERTPGAIPGAVVVDLSVPDSMDSEEGARITVSGDSVMVDFAPDKKDLPFNAEKSTDHDANLAKFISDTEAARIVQDVVRWTEADVQARKPWIDRLTEGLVLLGVVKDQADLGPLGMTENVSHPLLAEAAVQYQSRAITELFPSAGPAKWEVLGDVTEEKEDSAERLASFLNFSLTVLDRSYYNEFDRMLFVQSYEGSQFKKIAYDPLIGMPVARWVRGQNFLVPYGAASLQSAQRYTHVQEIEHNDVLKLQDIGFYVEGNLGEPTGMSPVDYHAKEKRDEAAGTTPTLTINESYPHIVLECHANWDLQGFGHKNEAGKETGIALPYIAHVEQDSHKLLALYRNWKKDDKLQKKRVWFVHYPFIPGDGFYSYGYVHLAAGLARASTTALRLLLIGSAFASIAGGFKSKSGRMAGVVEVKPGVYQDTDMDFEELSKMFYTPPFKEPSEALFKTLGLLVEGGQRLFSTQEAMVGDAANTGPVGTTVALIEEGKKVFSAVHKRGHAALGEELQILRDVWDEYMPEEGYPYDIPGHSRKVFKEDFGPHSNIVPVSDPNIFSATQRISLASTVLQMAGQNPAMYDRREADRMMLKALRVPEGEIGRLLPDPKDVKRCDPVTENALIMAGRPVKVFEDQDHQAHYAVHKAQADAMAALAQQNPLVQQRMQPMFAHMAEHQAYGERISMMKMLGIPLPPLDLDEEENERQDVPPEIDAMISQRAAMAASQIPKPPSPQDLQQQAADLKKRADAINAEQVKLAKAREAIQGEEMNLINLRGQVEKEQMAASYERKLAAAERDKNETKLRADIEKTVNAAVSKVEKALADMKEQAGAPLPPRPPK